jgi:hypothetical protein
VTTFGQVFRRIGSPAAVSWPTFWVSLAFNFFLAFAGSFDDATAIQRLVVVVASQTTMFGLLLLCRATVLKDSVNRPRPWRTLVCFIAAGITRSLTAGAVLVAFLGPDSALIGFRLMAGVVVGIVVFVPTTIVVASWRDYRDRRAELLARRSQLTEFAHRLVSDIADQDRAVVERIRSELNEVLEVADPEQELQRWSAEVLRPLSHQLATLPEWLPPNVNPERVRVADVLRRATSGAPLMPLTTSATIALIAFVPMLLTFGWLVMLAFTIGVVSGGCAFLWAANRLLAHAAQLPSVVRACAILLYLALSGLLIGITAQWLLPDRDMTFFLATSTAILFGAFGVVFALARALSVELRSTLDDLQRTDSRLSWQVTRLRLVEWSQGTRFARALHGPVQGSIAVAVERLRRAPEDQQSILDELRSSLMRSLESEDVAPSWDAGVDQLCRAWDGICEITVSTREECVARLDEDPACREMALEILTEAVSNAVRHGHATRVSAEMVCELDRTNLVVQDNGQGIEKGLPGLGTRVLDSCALEWSREPSPGDTTLRAVLPSSTG